MRSSTHLNCLWHGKQLFASFVPNSTRWLFFCLYLLCVLLLLVFVAKDLQQLFFGRDSILELAKVHAGKASTRLPSKQCFIGEVSHSSVNLVMFSHFEMYLEQEKVVRMDFAERLNPY